jgi:hypothetical protein
VFPCTGIYFPGKRKGEDRRKERRVEERASDVRFRIFLEIRDLGLFLRFAELNAHKEGGNNCGYNENAFEEIFHRSMPRIASVFSFKKESLSTLLSYLFSI